MYPWALVANLPQVKDNHSIFYSLDVGLFLVSIPFLFSSLPWRIQSNLMVLSILGKDETIHQKYKIGDGHEG